MVVPDTRREGLDLGLDDPFFESSRLALIVSSPLGRFLTPSRCFKIVAPDALLDCVGAGLLCVLPVAADCSTGLATLTVRVTRGFAGLFALPNMVLAGRVEYE